MKKNGKGTGVRPAISAEAMKSKTGRTPSDWFAMLDKAGARKMRHIDIANMLYTKHKLSMWWCQMVANAFEKKHGLRDEYETCMGDFSSTVSRTFACGVGEIYSAWHDPRTRRSWLKGDTLEVSTAHPNKTLRGAWDGNTSRVEIRFTPKGPQKTQVVVDHMKMGSSKQAVAMKTFWSDNLDRLRQRVGV